MRLGKNYREKFQNKMKSILVNAYWWRHLQLQKS